MGIKKLILGLCLCVGLPLWAQPSSGTVSYLTIGITASDSTYTSGAPGFGFAGNSNPTRITNFVGTNMTPAFGGSALSLGCTNQTTVTVTGAVTGMVCAMNGVAGNPANIEPQCAVTAANTVTPQLCTSVTGTPASQAYAIRVIP